MPIFSSEAFSGEVGLKCVIDTHDDTPEYWVLNANENQITRREYFYTEDNGKLKQGTIDGSYVKTFYIKTSTEFYEWGFKGVTSYIDYSLHIEKLTLKQRLTPIDEGFAFSNVEYCSIISVDALNQKIMSNLNELKIQHEEEKIKKEREMQEQLERNKI